MLLLVVVCVFCWSCVNEIFCGKCVSNNFLMWVFLVILLDCVDVICYILLVLFVVKFVLVINNCVLVVKVVNFGK